MRYRFACGHEQYEDTIQSCLCDSSRRQEGAWREWMGIRFTESPSGFDQRLVSFSSQAETTPKISRNRKLCRRAQYEDVSDLRRQPPNREHLLSASWRRADEIGRLLQQSGVGRWL